MWIEVGHSLTRRPGEAISPPPPFFLFFLSESTNKCGGREKMASVCHMHGAADDWGIALGEHQLQTWMFLGIKFPGSLLGSDGQL